MAFVVADPCVKCKFTDCVSVCPVDCFKEGENMLVIDPVDCIDCGACVPACPVSAIYDSPESTPASQKSLVEANAVYRAGDPGAVARAETIVSQHRAANPTLMAVPPGDRAAAHAKS